MGVAEWNQMQSDALNRNMDLTKMEVVVPRLFEVLQEAVSGYAGKEQQAREFLVEYHHRYRNWQFVIQETWRYAVSNLRLFCHHPLNGSVVYLLSHILLDGLKESERPEIRSMAADYLLAFWFKLVDEMPADLAKPIPVGVSLDAIGETIGEFSGCHQGILRHFFLELQELPEAPFEYITRSYYQAKRLAGKLLNLWTEGASFLELRSFMKRLLGDSYRFWLAKEDPCKWVNKQAGELGLTSACLDFCCALSHDHFKSCLEILDTEVERETDHREAVAKLVELPDHNEIVRLYFKLPQELKSCEDAEKSTHISMLMRLKIMETRGLEAIHEETLREINFDIGKWIRQEPLDTLKGFLERILDVLEVCLHNYPEAALQIVRTIGLDVLGTENRQFIDFFLRRVIRMGFETPQLGGVSQHWQMEVNPAHLLNIRVWEEIIKKNPLRTKVLLSALIVELSLGGIYIRDTDLFQRDVSQMLHAPVRPVYNLVKQLAKLFPVYFNQIGAEGQLRTVSTDIDELTGRSDRLIHFLRKQSHVESNNVVVSFIEAIIEFWRTLDKGRLKGLVPDEVFVEIASSGPLLDEVHNIFTSIFNAPAIHHTVDLLDLSEKEVQSLIKQVPGVSERERQRAFLMIQLYQLLYEKYALSFKDIELHLKRASSLGLPDPSNLLDKLHRSNSFDKLDSILNYLLELKDVILTPSPLQVFENIYYKRHIAVDIPSMYGSYNERKFDALGITFRLENMANVLFEEIMFSFNLTFITRASFFRIAKFLPLFMKALSIDGISSNRLELQGELFRNAIEVRRFSHSQYMDIFRGFSEAIQQLIQTYYHSQHEENLDVIIRQLGQEGILSRYRREADGETPVERNQRVSESFLRDIIARTFGLQYFDHFIGSILTTLAMQKEELSVEKLDLLLSYDPEKTHSMIQAPNPRTFDLIHLGNKGYTLAKLYDIGIKVPPGFVISTEYFRCRSVVDSFPQSMADFEERVMMHVERLEEATGRRFGKSGNSLLLSVRSGAAVSMPGMMNTFLNVGINTEIVESLIRETKESWFAWDNYRRFIQSWGMSFDMHRDEFDAIMNRFKKRYGRHVKRDFSPAEIRELALAYKQELKNNNIELSDCPREQLFTAISQVMKSWNSPKAVTYRDIMGLSENWGTAVTIQAMVYGNLDARSGAGVMFTHDPWTSEDVVDPVGDFTLGNQGEDVVGGLVQTLPLSEKQRMSEGARKEFSLETLFPRVYQRLLEIAKQLVYEHSWAPQEIEFTFQGGQQEGVYVLQSRNMTARVKRFHPVFKLSDALQECYVGSGIGVSGGALSGLVAFDLEAIQSLRKEQPGRPIILIRSDTVPDDIREISISDGILTGKGGATSHAAIVAHRLGKICVVGFSKLRVWEGDRSCVIDGHSLKTGDFISIDGRSGSIYLGAHETEQVDVVG